MGPYVIGLTGPCDNEQVYLAALLVLHHGACVINCLNLEPIIFDEGTKAYESLVERFGSRRICSPDKSLCRHKIGRLIATSKRHLKDLEAVLWPAMEDLIGQEIDKRWRKGHALIFLDAASIPLNYFKKYCHELWFVMPKKTSALASR